jgi:hypothetical protein
MPNAITTGTRRLQTLGAWGLGSLSDIAQGMINDGYNGVILSTLSDAGATDAQLQNLWDNYQPGPDFNLAANNLMRSLAPSGAIIDNWLPAPAVSVINTAFGAFNLADQAAWNQISSLLSSVGAKIQEVARLGPKDPDVVQHVNDFNAKVAQFAGWYQQVFGLTPPNIPATVTLGILPVVPLTAAIVGGVVLIIAAAYAYGQWADVTKARLLAQTQSALISSGSSPQQISALLNPGTSGWTVWLQQNTGMLIAALAAIVIVPPLLRRR